MSGQFLLAYSLGPQYRHSYGRSQLGDSIRTQVLKAIAWGLGKETGLEGHSLGPRYRNRSERP